MSADRPGATDHSSVIDDRITDHRAAESAASVPPA
jgi:hypothetical protein